MSADRVLRQAVTILRNWPGETQQFVRSLDQREVAQALDPYTAPAAMGLHKVGLVDRDRPHRAEFRICASRELAWIWLGRRLVHMIRYEHFEDMFALADAIDDNVARLVEIVQQGPVAHENDAVVYMLSGLIAQFNTGWDGDYVAYEPVVVQVTRVEV